MTKEEIYKASDVLNTILDNYLHGGEAAEVVTKFEDELIKSNLTKEEPVSEQSLSNVQRFGKNWKEPVSEDLEEASKEWLRPQLDKSYINYGEVKMMELTHFDGYAMLDAIEFGMKLQKEQMMKDSVLCGVDGWFINNKRNCRKNGRFYKYYESTITHDKPLPMENGKDYRLITIKED